MPEPSHLSIDRLTEITARYSGLRLAVIGDYSLDRYLEIDPQRNETSIETGKTVYNITRIRDQAGAAGTIANNLAALGIGEIIPIGFRGTDGHGYELAQALDRITGVTTEQFLATSERSTFTYTKPLLLNPGQTPEELNRLDVKNWTPTPASISEDLASRICSIGTAVDGVIVLDQVDEPETGVVTTVVLSAIERLQQQRPHLPILVDSRRGLRGFPPLIFKMNLAELGAYLQTTTPDTVNQAAAQARRIAETNDRPVIVTLSEQGILGVGPDGATHHYPCHPIQGEIDIVGAGDAVSANLVVALAAGTGLAEALQLANAAASIVIHKLGTTGTASVEELRNCLKAQNAPHSPHGENH